MATLVQHDFVDYDADKRLYTLGLRVFELSHKVARVKSYAETALPIMKRLAEHTDQMVSLNVLNGDQMVVLERADPQRPIHVRAQIWVREPIHSTSTGKAVLAALPLERSAELINQISLTPVTAKTMTRKRAFEQELQHVRQIGFALSDEENEPGIRSIAVTIPNTSERSPAALSLAAPAFQVTIKDLVAQAGDLSVRLETL